MKTLYLGLSQQTANAYGAVFKPIMQAIPISLQSSKIKCAVNYLSEASLVLLTSPTSVSIFFSQMLALASRHILSQKKYICIGQATSHRVRQFLPKAEVAFATIETSEGLLPLLEPLPKEEKILYPCSTRARPLIKNFLSLTKKNFFSYNHYFLRRRKISRTFFLPFSDIILTSPSIVQAYADLFPTLPSKTHWCQGPISSKAFQKIYGVSSKLLKNFNVKTHSLINRN